MTRYLTQINPRLLLLILAALGIAVVLAFFDVLATLLSGMDFPYLQAVVFVLMPGHVGGPSSSPPGGCPNNSPGGGSPSPSGGGSPSPSGGGSPSPSGGGGGGSTPFLLTQTKGELKFENDFLFGKPNTAFRYYHDGLAAYENGLGGDTYVINNELDVVDGKIQLQVREIEPEESYIDSLTLSYIDIPEDATAIASADLKSMAVFEVQNVTIPEQKLIHCKISSSNSAKNTYTHLNHLTTSKLSDTPDKELFMATDDELDITIDPSHIRSDRNVYLLLDAYYRDWTLGSAVPFTVWDRLSIGIGQVSRKAPALVASFAFLFGLNVAISKGVSDDAGFWCALEARADTPYSQGSYRSLVVSVQLGDELIYLETIFPRYVQASKEVVQIPKDLVARAVKSGKELRVLVKSTKNHIVKAAVLFYGLTSDMALHELKNTKATHRSKITGESTEHNGLDKKDGNFLKTMPSDAIDLEFVAPGELKSGLKRRFILKAHGFYTPLSDATRWFVGNSWYDKLNPEDKKILRTFRTKA